MMNIVPNTGKNEHRSIVTHRPKIAVYLALFLAVRRTSFAKFMCALFLDWNDAQVIYTRYELGTSYEWFSLTRKFWIPVVPWPDCPTFCRYIKKNSSVEYLIASRFLHRKSSDPARGLQTVVKLRGNAANGVALPLFEGERRDPCSDELNHTERCEILTRKPSCRWQTRATLAKSLHGLRKSSGVVSCIAWLPIYSLPMVSYYVLYSNYL